MNRRISLQLKKIARVLPLLEHAHVPVYSIALDAHRPAPKIHTGAGPYPWISIGFGVDAKGAWTDYSTWLCGVELWRRTRPRPSCRIRGHAEETP